MGEQNHGLAEKDLLGLLRPQGTQSLCRSLLSTRACVRASTACNCHRPCSCALSQPVQAGRLGWGMVAGACRSDKAQMNGIYIAN